MYLLLVLLFPSLAVAQDVASKNFLNQMVFFGLLFAVMYAFIIRPQNKKAREHKVLLEGIKVGDEILTTGGLVGVVSKISDQFLTLALNNSVNVHVQKQAVVHALPKGTIKTITGA